jgi:hypothetical protein
LPDGADTPRQLADVSGEITLSVRYIPWGDVLDSYGNGNFTFGNFGGVMDATTGTNIFWDRRFSPVLLFKGTMLARLGSDEPFLVVAKGLKQQLC